MSLKTMERYDIDMYSERIIARHDGQYLNREQAMKEHEKIVSEKNKEIDFLRGLISSRKKKSPVMCKCGTWYIMKPKQYTNHCPKCPQPSHEYKNIKNRAQYMREYRKKTKTNKEIAKNVEHKKLLKSIMDS